MNKKIIAAVGAAVVLMAATATVIWAQSDYDEMPTPEQRAYANQFFPEEEVLKSKAEIDAKKVLWKQQLDAGMPTTK